MTETLHILHEPEDAQLANALVDQVESLLPQCAVTCSSLPGYEAAGEERATAVMGVLTQASLARGAVAFKLGLARGHGKPVLAIFGADLDPRTVSLPIPSYLSAAGDDTAAVSTLLGELSELFGMTEQESVSRSERAKRDTVVDRPTPAAVTQLVNAKAAQEAAAAADAQDRPRPEKYQPKVSEDTQPRWSRPPASGAEAAAPVAPQPEAVAPKAGTPTGDGPVPQAQPPRAATSAAVPPPMAAPPPAAAVPAPPSPAIAARPSAAPQPFAAPGAGPGGPRPSQAPVLGQPAWPPTPSVAPRMPLDPLAPPSTPPQRPLQPTAPGFASRAPQQPPTAIAPAPSMSPRAPAPVQPAPLAPRAPIEPPAEAPENAANDRQDMGREAAYLAGRVFGRASFDPEALAESEAQLDATFGAYMMALGADWPALRALKDVDMWSEAADNMVTSLSAEQAHLGDWYALGLRVSALVEVAGLPTAPGEDEEVDALWAQNMATFHQLLAQVGLGSSQVAVVEGVLQNLRGSQSPLEEATRIDAALQESGRELDAA